MCGMKLTSSNEARIWTAQMESVRKDIECCYGILKVRFKIIANPVKYHSRISRAVRTVSMWSFSLLIHCVCCRIIWAKSTTQFGLVASFTICFWDSTVKEFVWFCVHSWLYFWFSGLDKLWTEEDYLSCWYVCRDITQCFPKVSSYRYADADA